MSIIDFNAPTTIRLPEGLWFTSSDFVLPQGSSPTDVTPSLDLPDWDLLEAVGWNEDGCTYCETCGYSWEPDSVCPWH